MPRSNATPNASPNFSGPPRMGYALVSTANANRDGTGTIATLLASVAAGADTTGGTRVDYVDIKAAATTTAGMIRLWVSADTGTTWRMIREIVVTAITVAAGVAGFESQVTLKRDLPAGTTFLLGASTHNAENFHITAFGADYL